jgi:hypothetical protein
MSFRFYKKARPYNFMYDVALPATAVTLSYFLYGPIYASTLAMVGTGARACFFKDTNARIAAAMFAGGLFTFSSSVGTEMGNQQAAGNVRMTVFDNATNNAFTGGVPQKSCRDYLQAPGLFGSTQHQLCADATPAGKNGEPGHTLIIRDGNNEQYCLTRPFEAPGSHYAISDADTSNYRR